MGFLLKATIAICVIIAVLIGYSQIEPTPPSVPLPIKSPYFGRGEPKKDSETIHKFKVNVKDDVLADLKSRLANTRFAESLEEGDFQYGFQTTFLKEVVSYWKDKYNWREQEAIINSFPQFITKIQGLDIHFIHAKPKGNIKGRPLLICHGWPGSIWEFYKMIPMLTDPVAHGGKPEDAFEVIAPSIPGYGFSEAAHKKGLDQFDTGEIFRKLMLRLGFQKFYVQGGDWGSSVVTYLAANHPENVFGIHLNMYSVSLRQPKAFLFFQLVTSKFPSLFFDEEDNAIVGRQPSPLFMLQEAGYFLLQSTKPDTVGTGLNDSPAGLAAYILEKLSTWTDPEWRNLPDGGLTKKYTMDELLTKVMIYWINGNIMSSQRYYKEFWISDEIYEVDSLPVTVPSGLAHFPKELLMMPRSTSTDRFKNITQFTVMPRGGHFAAFEEPLLLAEDIRSFVRKVESRRD